MPPLATLKRWLKPIERTPFHPQWLVLRHRRRRVAWISEHAHGVVVDVGCGDTRLRAELPYSIQYIGIDYPVTIALGYAGRPNIFAEASNLPIASGSVDTVLLLDVLEHLADPGRAVAEVVRILRQGGKCLVHVPFLYPLHDEPHDYQRWTQYGLANLMKAHGLEISEIRVSTSPLETAAALSAIALAKGVVDAIRAASPSILVVPLLLLMVPLVNILGWFLSKLVPPSNLMPFSYQLLARR